MNHAGKNFVGLVPTYNYAVHVKNAYDKRNNLYFPQYLMGRNTKSRLLKRAYIELTGGWNHTYLLFKSKGRFANTYFYYGPQCLAITDASVKWLL